MYEKDALEYLFSFKLKNITNVLLFFRAVIYYSDLFQRVRNCEKLQKNALKSTALSYIQKRVSTN